MKLWSEYGENEKLHQNMFILFKFTCHEGFHIFRVCYDFRRELERAIETF